ncbi:beta-mannosidase [Holotrichia oblita]|uniref:Beta-mannosidase n=1 Tax=Holotrichia oblita TaxID=644536 RepID=A0ACB9TRB7_HOLOL|nr:beta-mannosidase [Holotrichia oblita]
MSKEAPPSAEELKKCLKDAGAYEENMSYDIMVSYYKAIKCSESMAQQEQERRVPTDGQSHETNSTETYCDVDSDVTCSPVKSPKPIERPQLQQQPKCKMSLLKPEVSISRIPKNTSAVKLDEYNAFNSPPLKHKPLDIIYHEPKYESPPHCNPKYLKLTVAERAKIIRDFNREMLDKFYQLQRKSLNPAPWGKPIPASEKWQGLLDQKSQLFKDDSEFGSPLQDDENRETQEIYTSRSGRQTKRKVYTDLLEDDSDSKKTRKDDDKPFEGEKKTIVKRPVLNKLSNVDIMKRSSLFSDSPKRTRAEKMFDDLKQNGKKTEVSQENENSSVKVLDEDSGDDVIPSSQNILEITEIKPKEVSFYRRVPPPIRGRRGVGGRRLAEPSVSNNASQNSPLRSRSTSVISAASTTNDESKKSEPEKTNCPICSEVFAQDKIEEHASSCGLLMETESNFDVLLPGTNSKKVKCNICDKEMMMNTDYEVHVSGCIQVAKSADKHEVEMFSRTLTILTAVLVLDSVSGKLITHLESGWQLRDAQGEYSLNVTVPGGVYSDLMNNKIINDIFYGSNDVDSRWAAQRNWTYSTTFMVDQNLSDYKMICLVFEGVDTFAQIYINDVLATVTDNMFIQYVINIKDLIKLGPNDLRLEFQSPIERAKQLYEEQALRYQVPPVCVPNEYNGECHVNHIRKMQASFSWDWGPAFPSMGIWKPVYVEAYMSTVIRYINVDVEESNTTDEWNVNIRAYFAEPPALTDTIPGEIIVELHTDVDVVMRIFNDAIYHDANDNYVFNCTIIIPKLSVKLWWPNGYGKQQLYNLSILYWHGEYEYSKKDIKIGFRTVELVQHQVQAGNSFYFLINNVPIFAKGTNSIPTHILPEKGQDLKTIEFLLRSAKLVNMNMIRVWGGGVYESDIFYDLADEYGLMIWQDFMFACGMYPTSEDFLSSVRKEVRHQVRRLQHHPSVVLWAGNNENEAALRQNWYDTQSNFDIYHKDYIQLYVDTIRDEVLANDRSRPFLVSSPTNGVESEQNDYIATNPQSEFYGDVHHYDYYSDPWDQSKFPISRFSSEYGLQSYPSVATMLTATTNLEDLRCNATFLEHRQHQPMGNYYAGLLMETQFHFPDCASPNFYKTFSYYSQIIQAVGIKRQTEFNRLWRSNLNSVGQGLTMGSLYWQLNDVWAAPSWSGIDFGNNWKMLHYFAKEFFAPVIFTYYLDVSGNFKLYVVSDLLTNSYNNTATIFVYKWDSTTILYKEHLTVDVLSGYSKEIKSFWISEYLSNAGCGSLDSSKMNCFMYLVMRNESGKKIAPDNYVFPTNLKKSAIIPATVEILSVEDTDGAGKIFEIDIKTDSIALFVWLDSGNIRGLFSSNGFVLVRTRKTVRFIAEDVIKSQDLLQALTITHAKDAIHLA